MAKENATSVSHHFYQYWLFFVSVENSETGQTRNISYSLGNAFTFLKSSGKSNFLNIKVLCSLHFESMHSSDSF